MLPFTMTPGRLWHSWLVSIGPVIGLFWGGLWVVAPCSGSDLSTNTSDYTIENWQVEQGLPQISVTSIAQTSDGYLWLGTFNGLVRFDGVRFTVFNDANTPAMCGNSIHRLITDPQGTLWILTQEGKLASFAEGQFTSYGPEQGLPSCGVAALVLDSDEHVLVVDRQGVLYRVEKRQLKTLNVQEAQENPSSHLLVAPSEPCWVQKQGKAANSSQTLLRLPACGAQDAPHLDLKILCATRSREGGFWLAATSGVYRLQNGCVQEPALLFESPKKDLVAVAEDRRGNLWIGSWAEGLLCRDAVGHMQWFSAGSGLSEKDVASVFVDREDNVWVGTFTGGLHRFKPRVFRTYDMRDGLSANTVMSVTEDCQGRIWIGMNGGGVNCWQDGKIVPVMEPLEIGRQRLVYSVLVDREDRVWLGLYDGLVLRLQNGTVTASTNEPGFHKSTPRALFQDRDGTVWLGCDQRLQSFIADRFTSFTRQNGLSHDQVRALAQDHNGTLYIATKGGGLNCLRNNMFSCYTERDGLPDNHVAALWVDRDDTLWVGTDNGGLGRFQQGRFAAVTTRDGLPSNTIGTLLEDDAGYLWLGSNRGIIRVNRRELNKYMDDRNGSLVCHVYNRSDGLNSLDCYGGGQPASWKARDGRLWFATVKGVAVVDPDNLPVNALPPSVVIEEVVVDDVLMVGNVHCQPLQSNDQRPVLAATSMGLSSFLSQSSALNNGSPSLLIRPGKHRIEFRFTGLSLVAPEKIRFRYRLNGLDKRWTEVGAQRRVSYQHIPPGAYLFEVTACNNDGVWNENTATLGVVFLRPWWMMWWFRALVVMSVAGMVLGWYERRLNRLKHEHLAQESFSRRLIASQETERQYLAGELHDGMGQDLLVIASQAQLSLREGGNPAGTEVRLKDIAETAKHALQQARSLAHNLRPGLVEELGITKAIKATLTKAAQASGMTMVVELTEVDGLLPPEFEVNLFRIVQEIVSNVLKHACASETKITLTRDLARLMLVVEDNGCGFELALLEATPPDQRGFGLHQIAERAKMMGGHVIIQSQPAHGTRLTLEVPLPCGKGERLS